MDTLRLLGRNKSKSDISLEPVSGDEQSRSSPRRNRSSSFGLKHDKHPKIEKEAVQPLTEGMTRMQEQMTELLALQASQGERMDKLLNVLVHHPSMGEPIEREGCCESCSIQ